MHHIPVTDGSHVVDGKGRSTFDSNTLPSSDSTLIHWKPEKATKKVKSFVNYESILLMSTEYEK